MSTEHDDVNPCAPLKREICEPAPPPLDWGPFAIGLIVTLILAALAVSALYLALTHTPWWLLAEIVWVPFGAMAGASSIGVLTATRRQARRERYSGMTSDKGWRSHGEEI